MSTKIFVGSLSYNTTDDSLRTAFEAYGTVVTADVIKDRDTNRSKGFGFVEMATPEEAQAAIKALNETDLDGRTIIVNIAKPREDKPRGGNNFQGGFQRRY